MNFFGDYHTHTVFSKKPYIPWYHAKGSIEDNVAQAKKIGLKEIAITDHGFNHSLFGCSRKNLKSTKEEILRLAQKHDIKVYFGVEANFLGVDGTIDVVESDREFLDIVLCGFHKPTKPKTFKDMFNIFFKNFFAKFFGTTKKMYDRNTQMVLNALDNNTIDVLTHLNSKMKCDVVAIAKKAAEKGTLIELNERHCDFSKSEVDGMLEVGANFIVNSDAHKPEKIGRFKNVESIIDKYNIPKDRIVNLDKLPNFLSLKTKK